MKKVSAYQTSDGQFHQDKIPALLHEFKLDIRDLIISGVKTGNLKTETLNIKDISEILAKNFEPLYSKMIRYKKEVRWAKNNIKISNKAKPQTTIKEILGNQI